MLRQVHDGNDSYLFALLVTCAAFSRKHVTRLTSHVSRLTTHTTRHTSHVPSFVPPDGKFKIAAFVVSPSACHRHDSHARQSIKICNSLFFSVQLPIYVKPQITCGGNTAQVNIMVGLAAAASLAPASRSHATHRAFYCLLCVSVHILQVGPKQQLAASPAHAAGTSGSGGGAGGPKERKMAEDVVVTIHIKTPLLTNTLHASHGESSRWGAGVCFSRWNDCHNSVSDYLLLLFFCSCA